MALQGSGAISLDDIHVEAGGTTATEASINDADIRGLISKSSGVEMSFNGWYGASSIIALTAQSNTIVSNFTSSITATTPSFAAGDIAIVTIFKHSNSVAAYPSTPTGFTSIATAAGTDSHTTSNKAGTFTSYAYYRMRTCYKVLEAGDTSIYSLSHGTNVMSVEVYRPDTAITTVAVQDLSSVYSNTINCSASSVATIAFGASGGYAGSYPTHTWGAGPSTNQALSRLRASSYVQGASPSDVTWSSNSYTASLLLTIATSGYLEIS
jgi:hypothetical protein